MPPQSHIHVRQLELGDFTWVRELAAGQANFTIPPPYVLWLLLRIKDAVCLVAEHTSEGPLAYLLAVPIETPARAVYVWQLAASESGQRTDAIAELLTESRRIAKKMRIRAIIFSTVPGSPEERLIRRYSETLFAATPLHVSEIPDSICHNESEYRLELPDANRSRKAQTHTTKEPR